IDGEVVLDRELVRAAPRLGVGLGIDDDLQSTEPLQAPCGVSRIAALSAYGVAQHVGDLQSPQRRDQRALGGDATQDSLRYLGGLVREQPGDGHRRIDDEAHPRRPSASRARIALRSSRWRPLSAMISSAAAAAAARTRAERRRITISPSCAWISTRSPAASPAFLATSKGTRMARFFPHRPTVACDMTVSGLPGYPGIFRGGRQSIQPATRWPSCSSG